MPHILALFLALVHSQVLAETPHGAPEARASASAAEAVLPDTAGLQEYIAYALIHNPGVKAAFEDWQATVEGIAPAGALPDPRLGLGYQLQPIETRLGPQRLRLGIAQTIPWPGKRRLGRQVEEAAARAAKRRYEEARLELAYRVRDLYWRLFYLDGAAAVQRDNLQLLAYLESVAQTRYRSGGGTQADVLKIQVERDRLADEWRRLEDRMRPLQAQFNAALNRPLDRPVHLAAGVLQIGEMPPEADLQRRLRQYSPLLGRLSDEWERARSASELAAKQGQPDWTVGVDYIVTGRRETPVEDNGKDALMASIGLNLPLAREKYRAQTRRSEALERSAEYRRRDQENLLLAQLEQELYGWRDSRRRLALYRDTLLPRVEQALSVIQQAFTAGKGDFLDVIDVQRTRLGFQLARLEAVSDVARTQARIERLIGGWDTDFEENTP